jgi:hypothetical protein
VVRDVKIGIAEQPGALCNESESVSINLICSLGTKPEALFSNDQARSLVRREKPLKTKK